MQDVLVHFIEYMSNIIKFPFLFISYKWNHNLQN